MGWTKRQVVEHWHGVDCSNHCLGFNRSHGNMDEWERKSLGARCACGGTFVEYREDVTITTQEWKAEEEAAA